MQNMPSSHSHPAQDRFEAFCAVGGHTALKNNRNTRSGAGTGHKGTAEMLNGCFDPSSPRECTVSGGAVRGHNSEATLTLRCSEQKTPRAGKETTARGDVVTWYWFGFYARQTASWRHGFGGTQSAAR